MNTEQNKAGKAAKTITKIDLDKDKPFSWEEYTAKYGDCPPDEVPEFEPHRCEHEDGHSVCLTIPNLHVRNLPLEYEIRLKYKDEDVKLVGKPGSIICNNIQKVNQPVLKLAIDAMSYSEEFDLAHQPWEEKAA
jgi:hypothetical protein